MRAIDLYYLVIIPVAFAWMCEFGGSFLYHFAFFDFLCILRVLFNLGRAKVNEYGQLVTAPNSKRELYLWHMNGWYEVIGAIPFDWIVMVSAMVYSPQTAAMHCFNPHYYGRGNVEMSAEQARLSLGRLDVRFGYTMDDIPTFFMIYSILRFVRLVGTMGTIMWILRSSFSFLGTTAARLAKNLLICVFITHLNACAWWFMSVTVPESQRWITLQFVVRSKQGFLTTWIHRYITTYLASQRAMFFVTRETDSLTESAYQIIENLFAACTFGSIIGNLSQIVRSLDTQATLDKVAKVRNVRRQFLAKYMIKNSFPPDLQRKVLDHEEFDWIHKRGMDTEDTFHHLPRSLFLEVSVHLYFELVSKVPIFNTTSDVFRVTLCEKMSMISVRKGFYVCKAGDQGSEMFFIRSGSVEVLSADESKVFVTLKPGGFFGEVALFKECRRTATVRTTADTVLCVLRKSDFNAILDNNPSVREEFRVLIQKREEDDAKRKQQEEQEKARKEAEE
ncbi:cyclic nucleotide-binding-like protein, partial [Catenaria anguillulae PL171]